MRLWGAEAPKRGRRLVERRGRDTKVLVKWLGCPDAGGAPKCWRSGWAGLTSSTHSWERPEQLQAIVETENSCANSARACAISWQRLHGTAPTPKIGSSQLR